MNMYIGGFFSLILVFSGCKKDKDIERDILMKNYCAIGASTASQRWQTQTAYILSEKFNTYAVAGARWTVDRETKVNTTGGQAPVSDNVMVNQVIRLLKEKAENGYNPDLITIMCGLNDYIYVKNHRLGSFEQTYLSDIDGITPEQWLNTNKAEDIRLFLYGSLRFCLETLITEFPESKIVLFTVQKCYFEENFLLALNGALKRVADKYSNVHLIDIYNDAGLILSGEHYNEDMLHLNSRGEDILSIFVTKEIKKLFISTN